MFGNKNTWEIGNYFLNFVALEKGHSKCKGNVLMTVVRNGTGMVKWGFEMVMQLIEETASNFKRVTYILNPLL